MRIVIFTASYPPRTGGLESVTSSLARGLEERGHEITVITNRYPRSLSRRAIIDRVPVRRYLFPVVLPRLSRSSWTHRVKRLLLLPVIPLTTMRLVWRIGRLRPDILNIHYFSDAAIYALVAARFWNIPTVVSFHGSDVPLSPFPTLPPWPLQLFSRWIAHGTVCSNDLLGRLTLVTPRIDAGRISVVYAGVDGIASRSLEVISDAPCLIVCARLVEKKGVSDALQAVSILHRQGREVRLSIVGDGPERGILERLASQLGIERIVRFAGECSREQTLQLMANSEIVVVPSLWEPFGVVCLEAMALAKPVVATRSGGPEEIVIDGVTGHLVPVSRPAELARAIDSLLRNPEQARALGESGRDRSLSTFNWTNTVDSFVRAYSKVIADHSSRALSERRS